MMKVELWLSPNYVLQFMQEIKTIQKVTINLSTKFFVLSANLLSLFQLLLHLWPILWKSGCFVTKNFKMHNQKKVLNQSKWIQNVSVLKKKRLNLIQKWVLKAVLYHFSLSKIQTLQREHLSVKTEF